MAAPDDLLENVSKNTENISRYFESTQSAATGGTTSYFTDWFFSNVRVKDKGSSDTTEWGMRYKSSNITF